MTRTITAAAIAAITASAGLATGGEVAALTFGFTDLNLDYDTTDGNTGTLSVTSKTESAGDVTDQPEGVTARFDPGYSDLPGDWDVTMTFDISNIGSDTADAVGSFSIIDADGDEIAGFIDGSWTFDSFLNTLAFSGDLTDVQAFTANGDGMFEGTDGNSFSVGDGPLGDGVNGALVELSFAPDTFFSESFDGFNGNFSGVVVPAPGAAALLGLGGIAVGRRRR